MHKTKLFKKENSYLWWLILTTIMAFLFIPALNIKFWWVDDGIVISYVQKIISSITSLNLRGLTLLVFEQGGRFRTIYWLYQILVYIIGGLNPVIHFAIHFLVILVASIYILEIVKAITRSNLAGFFASILYILTPTNTENLYRLGPQEPMLALFAVASLYYLLKSKVGLAVVFLFLSTFVKEAGFIVWLPILGAYLLKRIFYKKRDINLEKYCFWGFVFFLLVLVNIFFRKSGYSTYYVLNFGRIVSNSANYLAIVNDGFAPFLGLFTLAIILRIILSIRFKKIRKEGPSFIQESIFIVLPPFFVVVQSPWEFMLSRYMMPATAILVIFMGIEFNKVKEYVSKRRILFKWLASILFIAYFTVFISVSVVRNYIHGEQLAYTTNFIQELFSYLAKNVPKNEVVLYNFIKNDITEEPVIGTGVLLNMLYNRPDITVSYLDLENIPDREFLVVGTTIVKERYSRELIEKSIKNYKREEDIVREKKFLVLTTPFNLVKQTVIKFIGIVIYNKPLNPDGIYTYYLAKDYWYKYQSEY